MYPWVCCMCSTKCLLLLKLCLNAWQTCMKLYHLVMIHVHEYLRSSHIHIHSSGTGLKLKVVALWVCLCVCVSVYVSTHWPHCCYPLLLPVSADAATPDWRVLYFHFHFPDIVDVGSFPATAFPLPVSWLTALKLLPLMCPFHTVYDSLWFCAITMPSWQTTTNVLMSLSDSIDLSSCNFWADSNTSRSLILFASLMWHNGYIISNDISNDQIDFLTQVVYTVGIVILTN